MREDRDVVLRILGPVRIRIGDGWSTPGPAQLRLLVGLLAWQDGRVVPVEELVDAMWDSEPPRSARASLQSLVTGLRHLLEQLPDAALARCGDGYRMELAAGAVDLDRFRSLSHSARAAAGTAAIELFDAALELWRGEALADACDTAEVRAIRQGLAREHMSAVQDRLACLLECGRLREAAAELPAAAARHPLDEAIAGMLMTTLYRSGQRADALRAFRQLRLRLDAELGVEPGPDVQRLHQRILSGDADPAAVQPLTPPGRSPGVVPRQLPAAPGQFVGRAHELRRLDETIGLLEGPGQAPVVWLITGSGGIGKSSLAAHWAHRAAGDFPDGQLYLDFKGFSPAARPVRTEEAIRGFLPALGVPYTDLPESVDAQTALYRSMLSGKRVLVVLDNALDAEQVRALIPGGPGCAAVVTSRSTLEGVVVSVGARVLNVDVLSQAESRELITCRIGAVRARGEAGAVAELARSCGGLPLALAIVAAHAAARPAVPLTAIAAEFAGQSRLDALETSEEASSIREVLSWSYRQLNQSAARMFRLLGLHPGPSTSIAAAAGLGGIDQVAAHRAITELTQAHLLGEHVPGRFFCHDLLHAYAAEQAAVGEDVREREAATRRLVDHYLHSATAAARVLYPSPDPLELDPMQPGASPEPMHARKAALEWMRAEHRVLLAVIDTAAAAGLEDRAWKLAAVLTDYLDREGHWHDLAAVGHLAIAAARRSGDQQGEAHAHFALGTAYLRFGWHDAARRHLLRAIAQFCDGDATARRAHCHVLLGRVLADQGLHTRARIEAEHALELYRAARHRVGEATALGDLGSYLATLGDHATAVAFCRSAVYLHREVGNRAEEAHAWNHLGFAMHKIGDEAAATDCYRRALDLLQEVSDRPERAAILTRLGDTYRTTGNRESARAAWRQALTILDRLHDRGADDVRSRLQDGLSNVAASGLFEP